MSALERHLTEQFIRWEVRGRGWTRYAEPVALEPPFRPFHGYERPALRAVDDGRRETFLSRWLEPCRPAGPEPEPEWDEPSPDYLEGERDLVELRLIAPPKLVISMESFGRFPGAVGRTREALAFELAGAADEVVAQLTVSWRDVHTLERQLRAFFPEAVLTRREDSFPERLAACGGADAFAAFEFGLRREFLLPLATFRALDADPLIGIAGVLGGLQPGEFAVYQVLFQATRHDWTEPARRTVIGRDDRPVFTNAEELAEAADTKLTGPLFAVVVRVAVLARDEARLDELLGGFEGALSVFDQPDGNQLLALDNEGFGAEQHLLDVLHRTSHRTGMLLNREELTGLAHVPSTTLREPKLVRSVRVTRAAPERLRAEPFQLGENEHEGVAHPVGIGLDDRVRHVHVLGGSGTGKSTFLLNCLRQDLAAGRGFALLDPAGDLVDQVLASVPPERRGDVILFDPADEAWPVGFNVLTAHSELERNLLAADLTAVFRRQSTSWGDVMNTVLANAILAFLESERGGTLADLRRFLVEPGFRKQFLASVGDPEIRYYWEQHFPTLTGRPQSSIVTRLDAFLRPKAIRHMVCQRDSRLDLARVMDTGRVFLARLPKGLIGEENAHLLAALLVAKFQQVAMARQAVASTARRDFFLYLDEFADIRTPSVAQILAGARKYRLGLVLAHQDLRQLQTGDDAMLGAVLANCQVRVCFKLGEDDARKLAEGFAGFTAADLTNLGVGEAVARVGPRDDSFNLRVPFGPSPHEADVEATLTEVRQRTRERYARARDEVAAEYLRAIGLATVPPTPPAAHPTAEPAPAEGKAAPVPPARPPEPVPATEAASPAPPLQEPVTTRANIPAVPASPNPAAPESVDRKAGPIREKLIQGAVPLGYSYVEEEDVLGGAGRVDLVFRRGEVTVACEICATTPAAHEVGNLLKCLRAGFAKVALVCDQTLKRHRIGELLAQEAGEADRNKVRLLTASQCLAWLGELAGDTPGKPALILAALSGEEQAATYSQLLAGIAEKRRAAQKRRKP